MDWKPLKDNKWLMVLAVMGVLFLIFGSFLNRDRAVTTFGGQSGNNTTNSTQQGGSGQQVTSTDTSTDVATQMDTQLATILNRIDGIHAVSVMVTLDSSGSIEVANNVTESKVDSQNKNESTTKTSQVFTETNNNGSRTPYVVKRVAPTVRGVLVTVNADDFYLAKSEIIDAITNVLDVPAYKISVEPQKAG